MPRDTPSSVRLSHLDALVTLERCGDVADVVRRPIATEIHIAEVVTLFVGTGEQIRVLGQPNASAITDSLSMPTADAEPAGKPAASTSSGVARRGS